MVWRPVNPNALPKWQQPLCHEVQKRHARRVYNLYRKLAKTKLVNADGAPLKGWAKKSAEYDIERTCRERQMELDALLREHLAESKARWIKEQEETAPVLAAAKQAEATARSAAYRKFREDVEQRRLTEAKERRRTSPKRSKHVEPPEGWAPHMEAGLPDRFWLEGKPDPDPIEEPEVDDGLERHPLDRPRSD